MDFGLFWGTIWASILIATSSPYYNCMKDGIMERSCHQIIECKNGKASVTTCKSGEAINFQILKCQAMDQLPPPCGNVIDCSQKADGKYADIDQHCTSYHTCLAHHFVGHNVCPPGLVFNNVEQACDFPFNVVKPCGEKTI